MWHHYTTGMISLLFPVLAARRGRPPDRCLTPKDVFVTNRTACISTCQAVGGVTGLIEVGKTKNATTNVFSLIAFCKCTKVPGHKKYTIIWAPPGRSDDPNGPEEIVSCARPGKCGQYCKQQGDTNTPPRDMHGSCTHSKKPFDAGSERLVCLCREEAITFHF